MLQKAASSYSALCSYRFLFGLGSRKGASRSVEISFPESAFHHLAGFQYVTRNDKFVSKKRALYNVKSHKITERDFSLVDNLEMIQNRWEAINIIDIALQSCRFIMEYSRTKGPTGSKITAKYVISHLKDNNTFYFFFDGISDDKIVPVSCLVEKSRKYELGCTKWTVLKIEKKNSTTNQMEIIFCHNSLSQAE